MLGRDAFRVELHAVNGQVTVAETHDTNPVEARCFAMRIGEQHVGNILDHEYKIEAGRKRVAEASKKWFRVRDTYGIEVEPGYDDALLLAVTAAIDQMAQ